MQIHVHLRETDIGKGSVGFGFRALDFLEDHCP